ncbi:MAG: hypothetical protein JWO02_2353, partial [Solirubrobacterales bacterium]|nr:hypothetical protein [Solirubrobacterales bacterium]
RLRSPGEHAHWRAFQFLIADPDTAGWSTFQPANPAHFSTGLDITGSSCSVVAY